MRNRLLNSVVILAALPAFSGLAFAQTYGTPGYSPGAWKPAQMARATLPCGLARRTKPEADASSHARRPEKRSLSRCARIPPDIRILAHR